MGLGRGGGRNHDACWDSPMTNTLPSEPCYASVPAWCPQRASRLREKLASACDGFKAILVDREAQLTTTLAE
eukprot:12912622-Prorocentrum_lima.AAC.1